MCKKPIFHEGSNACKGSAIYNDFITKIRYIVAPDYVVITQESYKELLAMGEKSLNAKEASKPSPNISSKKFPLLEVLEGYFKRYKKSCNCDYDNEVGAANFITFIQKHHT